jgi:hypothetical protein
MRSGHSFPPLRAGLVMYLTRNLTPEASGALQLDQSETMHGSGTVIIKLVNIQCWRYIRWAIPWVLILHSKVSLMQCKHFDKVMIYFDNIFFEIYC